MLIHDLPVRPGGHNLALFHDGVRFNTAAFDGTRPAVHILSVGGGGPKKWVVVDPADFDGSCARRSKVYGGRLLVRTHSAVNGHLLLDSFVLVTVDGEPAYDSHSHLRTDRRHLADLAARPLIAGPDGTHVDLDGVLRDPSGDPCRPGRHGPPGDDIPDFDARPGLAAFFGPNAVRVASFGLTLSYTISHSLVRDVAISPDLRTLLLVGGGHVDLYYVRSGRRLRSFSPPGVLFERCAWSQDGLTFAVQGVDSVVVMDHD